MSSDASSPGEGLSAAAGGSGDRPAPLAGTRVVEITRYIQGPVAGMMLAALGADVIKIELVGRQDYMRSSTRIHGVDLDDRGRDWLYATVNRGKRALALDVTGESGRAVFHQLIARADVFLTNLRDGGLVSLGADVDTLRSVNDRLVYAQGGGLGPRGPLAQEPCQDTIGMAYSGFMDNASPTEAPNYPPGSMSDVLTGTSLGSAVMAGLLERHQTGKGSVVRATQLQTMLWMQLLPVGMVASIGRRMPRFVRDEATPLYSAYPTADGWIAIAAIHAHHWPPLARTLGLEHLLEDPRFARFEDIEANKKAIADIFDATFPQRGTGEWCAELRAAGVWCSPVNRVEDLPGDEQALANEYLATFPDGFVGTPTPFDVGEWPGSRGTAAGYSEHTDEILAELGYDEERRLQLRAEGAIW
jgi:crotonobetainyl-CoA:carnitine CoA-transferase CaiB-like acyl-CoA transferase